MNDEQRRQDLDRATDLLPVSPLNFDAVLRNVHRRLIMETVAVTLIVLTVCTLFGWIAFLVHGAIGNQASIQSLLRTAPTRQMTRGEDIVVGIPVSLTGVQSREGAFAKQGYDMWVDWINSQGGVAVRGVRHGVKLIYRDDQSRPDVCAQVTQSLITDDKVQFLLGSSGNGTIASEAMVAEKNRIPLVQGNGAAVSIFSRGYKYAFGVLSPANKYVTSILDMAAAQNPKPSTLALLSADDPFSQEVAAAALDHAPAKGFTLVFSQKYPNGATDLSSLLSEVKAKTPDILLNAGHLDEAIAINKAAKNLKLDAKIIAFTIGPSIPDFLQTLGKDANFAYGSSQWTPQVQYKASFYLSVREYAAAYKKRYSTQEDPHYHVAGATAAALVLQKAIEGADSIQPDKVRDGLARLDVTSFYGRVTFDDRGMNSAKPMLVEQILDGKHHTVWPASMADVRPQYPAPKWTERTP